MSMKVLVALRKRRYWLQVYSHPLTLLTSGWHKPVQNISPGNTEPTNERKVSASSLPGDLHEKCTHKLPSKQNFLCEQSVFEPKGSDEVPSIRKACQVLRLRPNQGYFTHVHIPNKMRVRSFSSSLSILWAVRREVGR